MSWKLIVRFHGLCVFCVDDSTPHETMAVLVSVPDKDHVHEPKLIYPVEKKGKKDKEAEYPLSNQHLELFDGENPIKIGAGMVHHEGMVGYPSLKQLGIGTPGPNVTNPSIIPDSC